MILLDTHVLVWLDFGLNDLGAECLERINRATAAGELAVSAISFWEVAMLAQEKRVELPEPAMTWRSTLLGAGLVEIPVTGAIGVTATELANFHSDPADRMICATAQLHNATLVTADASILGWNGQLAVQDARV